MSNTDPNIMKAGEINVEYELREAGAASPKASAPLVLKHLSPEEALDRAKVRGVIQRLRQDPELAPALGGTPSRSARNGSGGAGDDNELSAGARAYHEGKKYADLKTNDERSDFIKAKAAAGGYGPDFPTS